MAHTQPRVMVAQLIYGVVRVIPASPPLWRLRTLSNKAICLQIAPQMGANTPSARTVTGVFTRGNTADPGTGA